MSDVKIYKGMTVGSLSDCVLAEDYYALKAENERLERNRDMWKGQVERQAEELTTLRNRIDDMSPFKGAPFTGPDTKCLACGDYHYGMSGLPCPNMRITAQADLPETRSVQIGAAPAHGEKS